MTPPIVPPRIPPATRGVAVTPQSPENFGGAVPAATPAGTSPIAAGGAGPLPLSPIEREHLRAAIAIVKQGRNALVGPAASPLDSYRTLAAFAYVAGFLEARGYDQLGGFLASIPAAATTAADLDRFISTAETLTGDVETRMLQALLIGVAACAVWDGIKWAAGKL